MCYLSTIFLAKKVMDEVQKVSIRHIQKGFYTGRHLTTEKFTQLLPSSKNTSNTKLKAAYGFVPNITAVS